MTFPAEIVPDGSVAWPHHYALGLYVAGLVALLVLNDARTTDPLGVLLGVAVGLFAWYHLWGTGYPVAGALGALAGLLLAAVFVVVSIPLPFTGARLGGFWSRYGTGPTVFVVLGLAVALDDWVSHALGVWTPLDWIWNVYIYPRLG